MTSSITLDWLKISFSSVEMNYVTAARTILPRVSPFLNLSHPHSTEWHFGEFKSISEHYSYNPRKLREAWWLLCNDLRYVKYSVHFIFICLWNECTYCPKGNSDIKNSYIYYIHSRTYISKIGLFMRNLNTNEDAKLLKHLAFLYLTPSPFNFWCRINTLLYKFQKVIGQTIFPSYFSVDSAFFQSGFSITFFALKDKEVLLQLHVDAVCSVSSAYFRTLSGHYMFQVSEIKLRSFYHTFIQ